MWDFLLGPSTDASVSASGGESGGRSRFNDDGVVSPRDLLAEREQCSGYSSSLTPRDNVIT